MSRKVIEIVGGVARHPLYRMSKPIDFVLCEGEQMAIVGPNGSGKTMLVNTLIGRYPLLMNEVRYDFGDANGRMAYENIHYIAFRDKGIFADILYEKLIEELEIEKNTMFHRQFVTSVIR